MLIVIRKKHLRFFGVFAFCCLLLVGTAAVLKEGGKAALTAARISLPQTPTFVVDAGHGGEDGGAVAGDGTVESTVNLAVAQRVNDLLRFCGAQTKMTRTSDRSTYSGEQKTIHAKKVSDLKNRVTLVNETENSILVSIHQNCLPSAPRVHGAQVFYNTAGGAEALAANVQAALNRSVNPGNEKHMKKISPSIYLMKHVNAPAVLIECGFLSNPSETAALQQPDYQLKLASAIAAGVLQPADPIQEEKP